MISSPAGRRAELLRSNDLDWLLKSSGAEEQTLAPLLRRLNDMTDAFQSRFGHRVSFCPEQLRFEFGRNPHRIRAFLQALSETRHPEMLLMVWRILQGLAIRRLALQYHEQKPFELLVELARTEDDSESCEQYRSEDINDAKLLRHFGITKANQLPLFDGFFPFRKN